MSNVYLHLFENVSYESTLGNVDGFGVSKIVFPCFPCIVDDIVKEGHCIQGYAWR